MNRFGKSMCVAAGMTAAVLFASAALGGQETSASNWLSAGTAATAEKPATAPVPEPKEAPKWEKPFPISFGLDYTLVSDYVWRGINLSEYPGEGREKLNHQANVSFSIDTKDLCGKGSNYGEFGASVWFEWFAGQERLTPDSDSNLQEVDFTAYWRYAIEPIGTTVELGWINYHFPRLSGDADNTSELYVKVSFDDSLVFGKPVLNPYIAYYHDIDDVQAGWLEVGVSHDFVLKDLGCEKVCILKDLTITPSLVLGVDHRYLDKAGLGGDGGVGTRLGALLYGLTFTYDLSGALGMSEQCGSIALKGFINYSQAFHDESEAVNDVLFGGFTVSYAW